MAKWLGRLNATESNSVAFDGRGDWVLNESLSFQSDILCRYWKKQKQNASEALKLSVITAPKGFHTDFLSVPSEVPEYARLSRSKRAGALHDFLYTNPHSIPDREICDLVLREMFIADVTEDGGATTALQRLALNAEADLILVGVRLCGAQHWE